MRPNEQRAKIAIIMIWVVFLADIILTYFHYQVYQLLRKVDNEEFDIVIEAYNNIETLEKGEILAGYIYMAVFIISGITFIFWFRRAYYNLSTITPVSMGNGWAAWAWVIPIVSFYRPYEIMKELYIKTVSLLSVSFTIEIKKNILNIKIWWALWIVTSISSNILSRVMLNTEEISTLKILYIINLILFVLNIPLYFITTKVIKEYRDMEISLRRMYKNEIE